MEEPHSNEDSPLVGTRGRPHYLRSRILAGIALSAAVALVILSAKSGSGSIYQSTRKPSVLLGIRRGARAQQLLYDSITVVRPYPFFSSMDFSSLKHEAT
jgi:hypothetical protein